MTGLGSMVATPGLVDAARASIESKVDGIKSEVLQRPKEPVIKKLLTDLLGTGQVDLRGELTTIKNSGTDIKGGVDALTATAAEIKSEVTTGVEGRLDTLKTELSKEIQAKKRLGFKGFLVRAGLVAAAALPAIAYLQENGLDFNPMVGGAGQAWNDATGWLGERWNQMFPPAEETTTAEAPATEAPAEEAPAAAPAGETGTAPGAAATEQAAPVAEEAPAPAAPAAETAQPPAEAPAGNTGMPPFLWGNSGGVLPTAEASGAITGTTAVGAGESITRTLTPEERNDPTSIGGDR